MLSEDEVWALMDAPERRGTFASRIEEGHFSVDFNQYSNRHFLGQTILRLAVVFRAQDVAIALLRAGADPRVGVPGEGPATNDNPFHRAVIGGLTGFVTAALDRFPSLLNESVRGRRPIWDAVECRPPNPELVQLLVDRGADLNFKIDKKYTFERYMKELWKPQPSRMDAYEPILKILGYR